MQTRPTYNELERRVTELTELLHIAFLSVCTLQTQLARFEHGDALREANKLIRRRVQQIGIWSYLREIDEELQQRPEHPLAAAAVRRARLAIESSALSEALAFNCPHVGLDGWGCAASAGSPCDWSHDGRPDPDEDRPAFHAERLMLAIGGGKPVPRDIVDRAADNLVG